jgi:hypothetical protein
MAAQIQTIENEAFSDDGVPDDIGAFFTESEAKILFLHTIWQERENILSFVASRTPEQLQNLAIGTLLDMMVGSVFKIIDGLHPTFPPVDLTAYPIDSELYPSPTGEDKIIEEGMMINDNFMSEEWESFVQMMNDLEEEDDGH